MKRFFSLCAASLAVAGLAEAQLNPIWIKYHNVLNLDDYGIASAIDGAGNVYMTGSSTNAAGVGVIFLTKFNPNGTKLWTRTYSGGGGGPDYGWVVEVDAAGNAIVAGDSVGIGTGNDLVTLKYDPAGTLQWVRRHNGPGNDEDGVFGGRSLGVDPAGNVVGGGYSTGAGTGYDWVVIKYSPSGALVWLDRINGSGNSTDACWGIAVDAAGDIYAGGDITGVSRDLFVAKYDAGGEIIETSAATVLYDLQGNFLWAQRYDEETYYYGHDEGDALRFDANGDLLMLAWGWSGPEAGFNTSVVKYSPSGLLLDAFVLVAKGYS